MTIETSEEGFELFVMSLVSFHGRVVTKQKFNLDPEVLDDTKLEVLDDLATDSIHICQGVQEVQDKRWKQYLGKTKLPLLEKAGPTNGFCASFLSLGRTMPVVCAVFRV